MSGQESLREEAKQFFDDISPSHDWHHVQRVDELAKRLASHRDDVDRRILRTAVILHDIGRAKEDRDEIEDHAEWGAEKAGEILREHGEDDELVAQVQHCIRAHRYSNDIEPQTVEAEILCDADNLDALGAVGVARVCCYGGENDHILHDPELPVEQDDTAAGETQLNHMKKKILNLADRMYTNQGREIAEQRQEFVRTFVERFEQEADGLL